MATSLDGVATRSKKCLDGVYYGKIIVYPPGGSMQETTAHLHHNVMGSCAHKFLSLSL